MFMQALLERNCSMAWPAMSIRTQQPICAKHKCFDHDPQLRTAPRNALKPALKDSFPGRFTTVPAAVELHADLNLQ